MEAIKSKLLEAVRDVNSSLKNYEPYWSWTRRLPEPFPEIRCMTFRQWIESQLNWYIYQKIPELSMYEVRFNGELFTVTSITGLIEDKRRFKEVWVSITNNPCSYSGERNFLEEISEVEQLLEGNTKFNFNYSQKKTKINFV